MHISEEVPEGELPPWATDLMRKASPAHLPRGRAGLYATHQRTPENKHSFHPGKECFPFTEAFPSLKHNCILAGSLSTLQKTPASYLEPMHILRGVAFPS